MPCGEHARDAFAGDGGEEGVDGGEYGCVLSRCWNQLAIVVKWGDLRESLFLRVLVFTSYTQKWFSVPCSSLFKKSRIRGVESYVSVNAGGIADGWLNGSKVSKAMRTMCCLQEEEGTWENSSARLAFNGCCVEPLDGEFVNSTKTWWHKKERDMP